MKIKGLLSLFYIMVEVGNLDIDLGVTLAYFHNDVSNGYDNLSLPIDG